VNPNRKPLFRVGQGRLRVELARRNNPITVQRLIVCPDPHLIVRAVRFGTAIGKRTKNRALKTPIGHGGGWAAATLGQ
jgi:hypothetical protein